jgi:hypothetical protein
MNNGSNNGRPRSVIAVAGRRIDPEGASIRRFPQDRVEVVRRRIRDLLTKERAIAIASSAACGADLIALDEAHRLGLRFRVVLPFAPARFRLTSVTDRPGDWGGLFDRVIEKARESGDLVVIGTDEDDSARAYAAANVVIIEEARRLAASYGPVCTDLIAAVVWEGRPRGANDATKDFQERSNASGFALRTVPTL